MIHRKIKDNRSGAGVGIGILKGVCGLLEIPQIQNMAFPKIHRFHNIPRGSKIQERGQYVFQKYV